MTIVEINTVDFGSTGNIMLSISRMCEANGINCFCFSGAQKKRNTFQDRNRFRFGSYIEYVASYFAGFYTGYESCFSLIATKQLIFKLKSIKPDIIHIHNLHGSYINYELLFQYIKKENIRVIWTLHDCWAFTGQCPHFQISGCNQWKNGCYSCSYPKDQYPKTNRNIAHILWTKKKKSFLGVSDLTIVTPSQWLAALVSQSFLKNYPIITINNGINIEIFKPTQSTIKERIGYDKKVVLGVALGWSYKKGLDIFVELAGKLPNFYQIVLVGTDDTIDKQLPKNIISIHRTQNQKELAELYSAADVFFNPTREDTFPTVNMEAIACGCPVVAFNTGGSIEMLTNKTGVVTRDNTVDEAYKSIREICENHIIDREDCVSRANSFDKDKHYMEYVKLFKDKKISI